MLLAEEVSAGRMEVLEDLSSDQLQKVLDELSRKRKRDANYLRESSKQRRIRAKPEPPDIHGANVHVVHHAAVQHNAFANAWASKSLQVSGPKARFDKKKHRGSSSKLPSSIDILGKSANLGGYKGDAHEDSQPKKRFNP